MKKTNLFEDFRNYRIDNGEPLVKEEQPKRANYKSYMKKYYHKNKDRLQEYSKNYYKEHKEEISRKKSKLQELVYNYYLQVNNNGKIPDYYLTAEVLGNEGRRIRRATKSLVKKGYLFEGVDGIYLEEQKQEVLCPNLFDDNEPDLYEDIGLEEGRTQEEKIAELENDLGHRDTLLSIMYDLLRNEDISDESKLSIIKIVVDEICGQELTVLEQLVYDLYYKGMFR